jgi:hypothetical protein
MQQINTISTAGSVVFVGLDVHKAFIQVAVLDPRTGEMSEWREPHTEAGVARLVRVLRREFPQLSFRLCYEAGPTHG